MFSSLSDPCSDLVLISEKRKGHQHVFGISEMVEYMSQTVELLVLMSSLTSIYSSEVQHKKLQVPIASSSNGLREIQQKGIKNWSCL